MSEDYQFTDEPESARPASSQEVRGSNSTRGFDLKLNLPSSAPADVTLERPFSGQSDLSQMRSDRYDTVTGPEDWQQTKYKNPVHHPSTNQHNTGVIKSVGASLARSMPRRLDPLQETNEYAEGEDYANTGANFGNDTRADFDDSGVSDMGETNRSSNDDPYENEEIVMSPRLQEIMMLFEAKERANWNIRKSSNSDFARQKAMEEAYVRCLNEREQAAAYNDYQTDQTNTMLDAWRKRDQLKMDRQKQENKMMRSTLDVQSEENKIRNSTDKLVRRNMKMAFLLPETAGEFMLPVQGGGGTTTLAMRREKFCRDLSNQIQTKAEQRAKDKYERMVEERDYLDHIAVELDMQNAVERTQHLEKQQALLEAWERDAHIRNLKELERTGVSAVQTYINNNLPDIPVKKTGLGSMSIGFDSRRR
jgi:hypothetical protein